MTSAESRLAAISNVVRVRVDGSKNEVENALAAQQRHLLDVALGDADERFRGVENLQQDFPRQAFNGQQVLQLSVFVQLGVTLHVRARA
jgi:hypothetical protein